MDANVIQRGVARLMVRRHLSDLIRPEIGTEDELVELFMRCARVAPDMPMKDVARVLRSLLESYLESRTSSRPGYAVIEPISQN